MSDFMFGVIRHKPTKREERVRERIANKHGATFVRIKQADGGFLGGFSARNYGEPFNRSLAFAVLSDVNAALGKEG
jgi:hypothetical protein